jgi:transcriptional regulator with XRE-family HTH domain
MNTDAFAVAAASGQPAKIARLTPAGHQFIWFGGALLVAQILGGTTTYSVPDTGSLPFSHLERWTNNGSIDLKFRPSEMAVSDTRSLRESVILLRNLSGLTWEQLAKLFGVSRRAVHLWASGGRMNSYHAELLGRVLSSVSMIEADTPTQRREMILAPGPDGRTLYEALVAERGGQRGVNAPSIPPEQLVGALHDRAD